MNTLMPLAFFGASLGGGEMFLVLAVALLLFGSKNLPKVARSLGKAMEEFRRAAREVSNEVLHGDEPAVRKPAALSPPKPVESKDPENGTAR